MKKQETPPQGIYALANPTSGITVLNLNNEFNLFGRKTYITGTVSETFPVINDAPVEKAVVVEKQGSWWANLATGVVVTAALAACAVFVVATGGLGLGAAVLIGAAIGAGAVTVSVAVTDSKNGQARTWGEFAQQLVMGTARGAMAGAMVYGLWTAIPTVANFSSFVTQYYTGIVSPFTYSVLPNMITYGGFGLLGAQGVRHSNEIIGIGSGQNWLMEKVFGGNQDNYDSVAIMMDLMSMSMIEVARNNAGFAEPLHSETKSIEETHKEGSFRRKYNTGEFSKLKESMTIEDVKELAKDAGIDYTGIKITIIDEPDLVGKGFFGYTHPDGMAVELYPDAFINREILIKTLGHERMHAFQHQLYGPPLDSQLGGMFEDAARISENDWWQFYEYINGGGN